MGTVVKGSTASLFSSLAVKNVPIQRDENL